MVNDKTGDKIEGARNNEIGTSRQEMIVGTSQETSEEIEQSVSLRPTADEMRMEFLNCGSVRPSQIIKKDQARRQTISRRKREQSEYSPGRIKANELASGNVFKVCIGRCGNGSSPV